MAGEGTGRPYWFRCSRCRRKWGAREHFGETGTRTRGYRVKLTGRTRPTKVGTGHSRNSYLKREYRCLDCDHVGWSRHVELERLKKELKFPGRPAEG